jgi:Flp pilus assembly protein TadB/Mg-chelatase subunit ChlD
MKRLLLIALFVLAACVFAGRAGAASSSSGPTLVEAKGPAYPVKTYVLTLPKGRGLTAADVQVTENGAAVAEEKLVPASQASRKTFGVVLLLDTSYSMRGEPIAAAVAAAQAFAAQRNPNEQLGLIEYNRKVTTKLELTNSATKIAAALASTPAIATGTHIYDAVGQAEAMLTEADIRSGSIVLLSDGQEHGNDTKTLSQVATAAQKTHTQIYTIGLADKTYKSGTLKALAAAGHGEYAQATPQALTPLFDRLSRLLSSEYLLQYKSLASADTPVRVKVQVNGVGTATAGYTTPALPSSSTTPSTYHESAGNRIWGSALTMIVLALLGAAVVAILVIGLLQPKRSNLPARMAEFVSIRGLQKDKGEPAVEGHAAQQAKWWTRFQETLEIADIRSSPETIIALTFAGTALTFLLIYAGTGSFWWALFALGIPYLVREWVARTLAHRRNRFAEQLPDALQVVASALRSGHSLAGSLAVVVESASEPMKSEMQHVVADEQLGIPLQQSLAVVAERMASSDVEQLALVAELQREAGGNAAEVVDRVAETVRERFDLKRLINTLTMQGRMSRWIVSALPIGILLVLQLENPHYLHPLFASTAGRVVFGLAVVWAVAGSFVIKRIVEIEV